MLEDGALREAAEVTEQPWFRLHHLLAAACPSADLAAFAARCRLLAAAPAGFERQLEAAAAMVPPGASRAEWDAAVEARCAAGARKRGRGMEPGGD